MRPAHILALWCAMSIAIPGCILAQSTSDHIVFRRANVIDGVSDNPRTNVTVVVRNGRIQRVTSDTLNSPPGATVIDLNGRWMLPGLIDTHVHLRTMSSARRALRSGVTTARSLGVNHFTDVEIRELHRRGAADLPDVIAAGYHVRRRMADEFFQDAPSLDSLKQGVNGAEDVRRVVRELIKRRVDVIKLMATERAGLVDTDFRRRVLDDAELAAAVDEARRAGIPVTAHAHTDEAARAAVRAGVRSVEHGTLITPETLELMRKRGTCFTPTLSFWEDMLDAGGEYSDTALAIRARAMLPRALGTAAAAARSNVKVTAGSDMRYEADNHRGIAHEMESLVKAGMSEMEVIRAATSTAAECLGVGKRTGSVAAGKEADLLVVDHYPLFDIGALRHIRIIVNNGRVAFDDLKSGAPIPSNVRMGIQGAVIDEVTGRPLAGARVQVASLNRVVATDSAGRYRLDSIELRDLTVQADAIGYIREVREIKEPLSSHKVCGMPCQPWKPIVILNFYMRRQPEFSREYEHSSEVATQLSQ